MATLDDLESNIPTPADAAIKSRPKRVRPSRAKPKLDAAADAAAAMLKLSTTQNDKVRIILEDNDMIPPTGQFIQVNGMAFMLRPGEPVDVPRSVVSVLNDAVMSVPILDHSKTVIGYKERMRFPYRLV